MFSLPAARNDSTRQLDADGYEVEIRNQHLLIHSVPYVTPKREVELGTLVSLYTQDELSGEKLDHTVYFQGQRPCTADGQPLRELTLDEPAKILFDDFKIDFRFSNKPEPKESFPKSYHEKVVHYVDLLVAQARVIDPNADARTGIVIQSRDENPIFRYPDSAAARAGILAISQKLALNRVAIVGLGGTGSYILDQIAKTPVREIHLLDGDDLKRHNAFRAPGAVSIDVLKQRPKKVAYYSDMYGVMRFGIVPHPIYLDATNVGELAGFDFVFVCVDDGPTRKLIADYLLANATPFIDVGMGVNKVEESQSLTGACRVTLCTPQKYDHLATRLPIEDGRSDLYKSNIQVGDINALNAMMAIIKWKQLYGFYEDYDQAHELGYSIAMNHIFHDDKTGPEQ